MTHCFNTSWLIWPVHFIGGVYHGDIMFQYQLVDLASTLPTNHYGPIPIEFQYQLVDLASTPRPS